MFGNAPPCKRSSSVLQKVRLEFQAAAATRHSSDAAWIVHGEIASSIGLQPVGLSARSWHRGRVTMVEGSSRTSRDQDPVGESGAVVRGRPEIAEPGRQARRCGV
jgi:hypothetical protein